MSIKNDPYSIILIFIRLVGPKLEILIYCIVFIYIRFSITLLESLRYYITYTNFFVLNHPVPICN